MSSGVERGVLWGIGSTGNSTKHPTFRDSCSRTSDTMQDNVPERLRGYELCSYIINEVLQKGANQIQNGHYPYNQRSPGNSRRQRKWVDL